MKQDPEIDRQLAMRAALKQLNITCSSDPVLRLEWHGGICYSFCGKMPDDADEAPGWLVLLDGQAMLWWDFQIKDVIEPFMVLCLSVGHRDLLSRAKPGKFYLNGVSDLGIT